MQYFCMLTASGMLVAPLPFMLLVNSSQEHYSRVEVSYTMQVKVISNCEGLCIAYITICHCCIPL